MNQNDKPPPSPGLITSIHCPRPARADPIAARIKAKTADYSSYEFTEPQSGALNIFFDLVQEFESEEDFRAICVMVPKVIFGLDCALYLVTPKLNLRCIACTGSDALHPGLFQTSPAIPQHPDRRDEHWYFPIRANPRHIKELPFDPPGDVIGCLEVHPAERMASGDSLFWEKYANRIGFQLHNRMMHETNERHLRFIRSLAKDIGHNVIVPNMYFKLFFNRLKRTIDQLGPLQRRMLNAGSPHCADVMDLQTKLDAQFSEIITHYEQTSLYLETLLRQSHFEKGHYVLERRACDMVTQIIEPQLHHYLPRLAENNIEVDQCPPRAHRPPMNCMWMWGSWPKFTPTCSPMPSNTPLLRRTARDKVKACPAPSSASLMPWAPANPEYDLASLPQAPPFPRRQVRNCSRQEYAAPKPKKWKAPDTVCSSSNRSLSYTGGELDNELRRLETNFT